jgi:hypothetical protein
MRGASSGYPGERRHLRVPVLLHDVDPLVSAQETLDLLRERIGPKKEIGRRGAFGAELIPGLTHRVVGGAESDEADLGSGCRFDDGRRHEGLRGVELPGEPVMTRG